MASVAATQPQEAVFGSRFVEQKLHRAWKKERHFHHTRGLCYLILWATALVLLDFFVDWRFKVPSYGRLTLLGVNVGALGWALYHHWFRYLRRYDPVRTALQVERRHPELQSLLVSFVQFRHGPHEGAYVSPSLLNALRRQTIEYTQPIDFREIVSYRELKRIFILSACVIAFFAAVSVNWSQHLRVFLYRMLNPEARLGYPTRTRITEITGNTTVQQGRKVTLYARGAGLLPLHGELRVKPQGGTWDKITLTKSGTDTYAYDFAELYQTLNYRIDLGDASSDEYTVRVVPPPRIVETRVRLDYPEYTGQSPQVLDILNLEVPEGTRIRWELRCDQPLTSAGMVRAITTLPLGTEAEVLDVEDPHPCLKGLVPPRIESQGTRFFTIIDGNTPLPARNSRIFSAAGTSARIPVLRGKDETLGELFLTEIPPPPPNGRSTIELTFDLDADGILKVTARHLGSDKEESIIVKGSCPPIRMDVDPTTCQTARLEHQANTSFDYSFRWKERKFGYEYKDEVRYFVQVVPDSAPQVEILRPLEDEKATVKKTLSVTYQARDDYGLSEAWIVYNVNDGEEKRFPLGTLKGKLLDREATWVIKKSIPDLKEDVDVITYAIEVADNHAGEGGAFTSRSQGRRLYIVSVPKYLEYLAERRRKLVGDIRTMHTQESEAAEKVGEIGTKKPE